jgi:hypothetical protein
VIVISSNEIITFIYAPQIFCLIQVKVVATAINEVQKIISKVYPNPTSDKLYLIISENIYSELTAIQIIGLDGRVHQILNPSLFGKGNIEIDVSNLPCGTYILYCVHKKGVDTIKFTKK